MTDIQAADLPGQVQAEHTPAVLGNRLTLAAQWGEPCLGYLVIGRPPAAMANVLATVQDQVQAIEPELHRQPSAALHSTVGFLVPVFRPVDHDKDEIWRQHGPGWLAGIGAAAAESGPLRLSFRRLVATEAAVIAVADVPNPVTGLRERLTAGLDLRWPLTKGPLVHVSLFRYRQPLRDPARLLDLLASIDAAIDTEIGELLVVRETTFPLLEYEVMQRVPIGRPVR
jgi:hypothetical protein